MTDLKKYAIWLSPLVLIAEPVPIVNTVEVGSVSLKTTDDVPKAAVVFNLRNLVAQLIELYVHQSSLPSSLFLKIAKSGAALNP